MNDLPSIVQLTIIATAVATAFVIVCTAFTVSVLYAAWRLYDRVRSAEYRQLFNK